MRRANACTAAENQPYVDGLEQLKRDAQQGGNNSKFAYVYSKVRRHYCDLNFFLKTHRKYLQAINSIRTAEKAIKTKADAKSLRFVGIDYIFRSSENAFSSSFRKFYYR